MDSSDVAGLFEVLEGIRDGIQESILDLRTDNVMGHLVQLVAQAPKRPHGWTTPYYTTPAPLPPEPDIREWCTNPDDFGADLWRWARKAATAWREDPCYDLRSEFEGVTPDLLDAVSDYQDTFQQYWVERAIWLDKADTAADRDWALVWACDAYERLKFIRDDMSPGT